MIENIILFYESLKYPMDGESSSFIALFFLFINVPILMVTLVINSILDQKKFSIKILFLSNLDLFLIYFLIYFLIFLDIYLEINNIKLISSFFGVFILIFIIIFIIRKIFLDFFIDNNIHNILYNYISISFLLCISVELFHLLLLYILNLIYYYIIFKNKKIIFYILCFIISLVYFATFFHIYLFDFIYVRILLFAPDILLLLSIIRLVLSFFRYKKKK